MLNEQELARILGSGWPEVLAACMLGGPLIFYVVYRSAFPASGRLGVHAGTRVIESHDALWLCAACLSMNRPRAGRCYRCGAVRGGTDTAGAPSPTPTATGVAVPVVGGMAASVASPAPPGAAGTAGPVPGVSPAPAALSVPSAVAPAAVPVFGGTGMVAAGFAAPAPVALADAIPISVRSDPVHALTGALDPALRPSEAVPIQPATVPLPVAPSAPARIAIAAPLAQIPTPEPARPGRSFRSIASLTGRGLRRTPADAAAARGATEPPVGATTGSDTPPWPADVTRHRRTGSPVGVPAHVPFPAEPSAPVQVAGASAGRSICPLLRGIGDARIVFTLPVPMPHPDYRCEAGKRAAAIESAYQASFCLTADHMSCAKYVSLAQRATADGGAAAAPQPEANVARSRLLG